MAVMGVTILRNASVLDPEKGELAPGQSVVVEGGRIADVGPGLSGPDDALILDAGGRTVMPGLIDAHTHPAVVDDDLFGMAEWPPTYVAARAGRALEGMLARGFTTIRDVGGGDVGLARAVEEGYFTGPRIRYGGKQLTQTGGAGDWRAPSRRVYDDNYYSPAIGVICDGVPEVRRAVREEVRRGAHHIKVYLSGAVDSPSDRVDSTQFSLEELRAIVEEATAANIYVTGHAYTSRAIDRGLECGVRCIEHGNLMENRSIPLFKKYGAFYVPTIVTYHCLARKSRDGVLPKDIAAKLAGRDRRGDGCPGHGPRGGHPDRLRHRPVRRHARSPARGVHHPLRSAAPSRPDQGRYQHGRPAAAARGAGGRGGAGRVRRPAGDRRQPAGGHPGAHHPGRRPSGSS